MKRFAVPLLAAVVVVALVLGGCTAQAPTEPTAPTTPSTPTTPTTPTTPSEPTEPAAELTAKDIPELAELVSKGMLDGDLLMNPFGEDFAVKPDGTPFRFAASYICLANDWMVYSDLVTLSLVRRAGAEINSFDPNFDANKQIAYVEDQVTVGDVDAMFGSICDETLLEPTIEWAYDQGVPMFQYDTGTKESDKIGAFVWHDFTGPHGTGTLGQKFVEIAEKENRHLYIFELWGHKGMVTSFERHEGFHSVVDNYPDLVTVIESADSQYSHEIGANLVADAFQTNPDLNAVFVHGAASAGVPQGLEAAGKWYPVGHPDHVICGHTDYDVVLMDWFKDGYVDFLGAHGPWDLVDAGVKLGFQNIVLGQSVPRIVDLPMDAFTLEELYTTKMFGAVRAWTEMPADCDLWPVLDTTEVGIETPTKEMRMQLQGY